MTITGNDNRKPVTIYREDGSSETVYIDMSQSSLRDHLGLLYLIVGTVALSLTAVFTVLQLKRMK
jgi:hypothetical protein